MKRPIGYLVQQRGLSEYSEICRTKREAIQVAKENLWWSRQVTVRPLYAGRKLRLISKREAARRARCSSS